MVCSDGAVGGDVTASERCSASRVRVDGAVRGDESAPDLAENFPPVTFGGALDGPGDVFCCAVLDAWGDAGKGAAFVVGSAVERFVLLRSPSL